MYVTPSEVLMSMIFMNLSENMLRIYLAMKALYNESLNSQE